MLTCLIDDWIEELQGMLVDLVDVDFDDRGREKASISDQDKLKWDAIEEAIEALMKVKEEYRDVG